MKFPNKVTSYNESILPIIVEILNYLKSKPSNITELYLHLKKKQVAFVDFTDAMDCAYALGKIDMDKTTGRIYYVV